IIDPLGGLREILDQLDAGDARESFGLRLVQAILKSAICRFHADDQEIPHLPDPEQGVQIGMANPLDDFQGSAFSSLVLVANANEFQGDLEGARCLGLPDLTVSAFAKELDQSISRQRLRTGPEYRVVLARLLLGRGLVTWVTALLDPLWL